MKTRTFALLLCLLLVLMEVNIHGTAPVDYSPQWSNITRASNIIDFSDSDGYAHAYVLGKSGTTSICGSLTVYRQVGSEWVYVDSVSNSVTQRSMGLQVVFSGISGVYYKAVFEFSVYCNGIEESDTITTYKTCP